MNILIKSGLVVTSNASRIADLFISEGKIVAIGENLSPAFKDVTDEIIDAKGKYVLPGAIDPHTHLAMPFMGTYSQDDFETGTIAAACGGITSIIDFDVQQKGESIHAALERKKKIAAGKAAVDYSFHPAITDLRPEVIDEIEKAIKEYGTPSFKVFMTYDFRVDDATLLKMLDKTKEFGGLVQLHAENYYIIEYLNEKLAGLGCLEPYYHAKSRPNIAEEEAVARAIKLAELTESRLYFVHVSSKEAITEIAKARDKGLEVYAETCPQYLLLNEDAYKEPNWEGAKYVMSPPLRTKESNVALWQSLSTGDAQTIGSDHCPFDFKGTKDMFGKDDYKKIPNGAPGLETSLMLMHSEGVLKGRITLQEMVAALSTNTANIFGLENKGSITVGKDADIVIFDPKQKFTIKHDKLHMKVDYNPYEGYEITGMPSMVFARGKKVAEWKDDHVEFVGKLGDGKFVKRKGYAT